MLLYFDLFGYFFYGHYPRRSSTLLFDFSSHFEHLVGDHGPKCIRKAVGKTWNSTSITWSSWISTARSIKVSKSISIRWQHAIQLHDYVRIFVLVRDDTPHQTWTSARSWWSMSLLILRQNGLIRVLSLLSFDQQFILVVGSTTFVSPSNVRWRRRNLQ
jgi:hypothetical protein